MVSGKLLALAIRLPLSPPARRLFGRMAASIQSTIGAEFIGNIIVNILFGLTSLQIIVYFRDYSKDPLSLKLPVYDDIASCTLLFLALQSPAILTGSLSSHMLYLNGASILSLEIVIASCFCLYLMNHLQHGMRLRRVVPTLIVYTISSTILTLAIHIPSLVYSIFVKNNYIATALQMMLPGLYVNSLLAWLNFRKRIREEIQNYFDDHGGPGSNPGDNVQISTLQFQPSSRSSRYPSAQRDEVIEIHGPTTTDSEQTFDLDKKSKELDRGSDKFAV